MKKFLHWVLLKVCESTTVGGHDGILFSDWNQNPHDDALFVAKTTEALVLIEQLDPRRYARIKRHLRYIQNTELYSGGRYHECGICQMDFARFAFSAYPEWSLYQYAGTIVHEATHGLLSSHGIRYGRSNWIRIEKICCAEQNRFLSRIHSQYGSSLLRPFAPKEWEQLGSTVARLKTIRRRMKEEELKAQQSRPV